MAAKSTKKPAPRKKAAPKRKAGVSSRPLTDRQQLFVEHYLKHLNATQAYIDAGYAPKNADKSGPALLGNSRVAGAISEAMGERSARVKIDADWVLQRLGEDVEADMAEIYDETGNIKPVREWPIVWRKGLVAGVETIEERDEDGKVTGFVRKVRLADRSKLKEMLGRHVGVQAFKDRVEHDVTPDLAAAIAAGNARVNGGAA
ncbi:terminase small subunit [Novosphingobium rosa]|uniref:terminase small subunit n=1 Tax=Novosphingobium rosa TaxID=76978 RepID=UPI000836779D|nr:terminase small subunit [Novosphingobium rosa]